MFEEHYFVDANGNKKLLRIEEISDCDPENKAENMEKIKQRLKCCYSNNIIYNKKLPKETSIKSIGKKKENNIFFGTDQQNNTDLSNNFNINLNHYKNLIKVNRGAKYTTYNPPKIFAKFEEKNFRINTTVNYRSRSKNHSYHEIKEFSKNKIDNNYSENSTLPLKYSTKRFDRIIHINNEAFNDRNDNSFTIRKRADTKLPNSNSAKNDYNLTNIREKQDNNYFFRNINSINYRRNQRNNTDKNRDNKYYSVDYSP